MTENKQSRKTTGNLLGLLATLVLLVPVSFAAHGREKLDRDLRDKTGDDTVDVIVQYNSAPTDWQALKLLVRGGWEKNRLDSIRGSAISVPRSRLAELADDDDAKHISLDRPLGKLADAPGLNDVPLTIIASYAWVLGYVGN